MADGSKKQFRMDFPKFEAVRVEGDESDQEIKGSPGVLGRVAITKAGSASSTVTIYDGTVAAGTQIGGIIDGTSKGEFTYMVYFDTSLHVETVDSGNAIEVTVTYL